MENIACKLSPNENYKSNKFFIKLIFKPSVPDNVTNWKVFKGDEYRAFIY